MKDLRAVRIWPFIQILIFLVAALGIPGLAVAQFFPGLFQLDGNATTDSAPGDDWENVFSVNGGASAFRMLLTDTIDSTSDNIFSTAGSFDVKGIQLWQFVNDHPAVKEDIEHAFVAGYVDPDNQHFIVYFGANRVGNAGPAVLGVWLLQNPIGVDPISRRFTGQHSEGDVLLISDFTIGGSTSLATVYQWTGDDSTGALAAVPSSSQNSSVIVNGAPITVQWSFLVNSGPAAGEFIEGGVDLTSLGLNTCFTSFLAETRASLSSSAVLHDFVLGTFPGAIPVIYLNGLNPDTVECHSVTSYADSGATATNACGDIAAVSVFGSVDVNTPGAYTLTYTAVNAAIAAAPVTRTVNVVDSHPPAIELKAKPIVLSPPDHKYRTIRVRDMVESVTDLCDSTIALANAMIASVGSDEPEDAPGMADGTTKNDIVISSDCKSAQLRSERDETRNGRVYTFTLHAADGSGHVGAAVFRVTVPIGPGFGAALDDGPAYTVNGCSP